MPWVRIGTIYKRSHPTMTEGKYKVSVFVAPGKYAHGKGQTIEQATADAVRQVRRKRREIEQARTEVRRVNKQRGETNDG